MVSVCLRCLVIYLVVRLTGLAMFAAVSRICLKVFGAMICIDPRYTTRPVHDEKVAFEKVKMRSSSPTFMCQCRKHADFSVKAGLVDWRTAWPNHCILFCYSVG